MKRARVYWAFAAAVLLQAFVVYALMHTGALLGPLPWDDCATILQGLENLDALIKSRTVGDFAATAATLQIHSPISGLQVLFGLLFTGGAPWGAYALSVVYLFPVIAAVSRTKALKSPWLFAAAMILFLWQPLTIYALADIKSDWEGGLFIAGALLVLFDAAQEDDDRGRLVGAGLLGLMLLAKMTTVYNAVLAIATFAAFEIYGDLVRAKNAASQTDAHAPVNRLRVRLWARLRARARLYLACLALILGPFILAFLYSGRHLIDYLRFGLDPMWEDHLGKIWRLRRYTPLGESARVWGSLPIAGIVLYAAAAAAAGWKRAWLDLVALAGLAFVTLVFLAPLVVAKTSGLSYAAPVYGAALGATLVALTIAARHAPKILVMATPFAALALAFPANLPISPLTDGAGKPFDETLLKGFLAADTQVAEAIAATSRGTRPKVIITFDHAGLPFPNLSIYHYQKTGRFLDIGRIDNLADPKLAPGLATADYALTFIPTIPGKRALDLVPIWPMSEDPAAGDARVRASGRFTHVGAYPLRGGTMLLYQATPQFVP